MSIQSNKQALNDVTDRTLRDRRPKKKRELFRFPFSERRALLLFGDMFLVVTAVFLALVMWQKQDGAVTNIIRDHWYWFPLILISWIVLSWLNDLYDIPSANRKTLGMSRVFTVSLLLLLVYMVIFFFNKESLPRLFFMASIFFAATTVTLWRWTYAIVFSTLHFRHRVIIVGQNERGTTIANALKREPFINYQIIGFVDNICDGKNGSVNGLPLLGKETDLLKLTEEYKAHEVVVAIERNLEKDLFLRLVECQALGVKVSWMPDLYEKVCRRVPIQHVDPSWALFAMQDKSILHRVQDIGKRMLDLVLIFLALPLLIIVIPVIAIAVRWDSPGPVFYRQVRCGLAGKKFYIYKFRTMTTDAEKDGRARWAQKNDPRITRIGRFLRKSRLDELPQLYNVLLGDMSVVGPRPERPEFIAKLEDKIPYYRTRLIVKPGITGWAQVHYDYGNTIEDGLIKLQYDFYYIRYQSLALDIYIMFRTAGVLFRLKGT